MTACSKENERDLKEVQNCAISFCTLKIIKLKKLIAFILIHPVDTSSAKKRHWKLTFMFRLQPDNK